MKKNNEPVEFGIRIPRLTLERIEAAKGPYLSRSKFIVMAVDRLLDEEEEKQEQREQLLQQRQKRLVVEANRK